MKTIIKTIINILIGLLAVAGFIFILNYGLSKSEVVQCHALKQQSQEFMGFYLTQWQKDMCDSHGIIIDAPIVGHEAINAEM